MKQPMKLKVAHVATVDISLSHLLLNQMSDLKRAGWEVTGISSPGPDVPVIERAGIPHIAVPMTRQITPLADLVSLWKLYRVMRRERFTCVHTHTPKAGLLGQAAARLAGVPIVVNTLHGLYFYEQMSPSAQRFHGLIEKIAARCSDVILSQNREDIQTVVDKKICDAEKIRHLGNGIDLTLFDPQRVSFQAGRDVRISLGIPEGAPVVGFVGRLAARRKGFLDFLAAAKEIAAILPEARFLIVGEADHGRPDAVDPSAAIGYGIEKRCHFAGHRPNSELPPYYKAMSVLVLPSLFEGVPRVVMEAAAMGVPAVVSNVKGNREAVEQGRNGFLVPLGDVAALSGAVLEILTQPETARRMSYEGRCLAAGRFDELRVFGMVRAEYERLLAEKSGKLSPS